MKFFNSDIFLDNTSQFIQKRDKKHVVIMENSEDYFGHAFILVGAINDALKRGQRRFSNRHRLHGKNAISAPPKHH